LQEIIRGHSKVDVVAGNRPQGRIDSDALSLLLQVGDQDEGTGVSPVSPEG
jgi:hypothetical protein